MFADGQAYVAVSRVRSFDGLTITKFDRSAIKSNEKVAEFYKRDFGYFKTLEDIS
jgi:ATP-dependent exoDNAse (exonuclease V) alpha subunit